MTTMLRLLTTVLMTLAASNLALGSPLCCIIDVGCCPAPLTPKVEAKAPCCPHCRPPAPDPEPEPKPDPAPECDWCDHPADLTLAENPSTPAPLLAVFAVTGPEAQPALILVGPAPEETTTPPRAQPARNLPLLL